MIKIFKGNDVDKLIELANDFRFKNLVSETSSKPIEKSINEIISTSTTILQSGEVWLTVIYK